MSTERRILWLTCAVHFLTHYLELLYPAMTMHVVRDLGASPEEVIAAGFPLYLLFGALAIPAGLLGDHLDPRVVLSVGVMIAGLGSVLAGAIGTLAGLWVCLAVVGLGISTYHPTGMALISKGIARRGRALGLNGVWGNVGVVTGPFVGGVGGYLLGWKAVLVLSGAAGILAGVLGLLLRFEIPRDSEKTVTTPLGARHAGMLFAVLLVVMAMNGTIYRATTVTLPVYFEESATSIVAWFDQLDLPGVGAAAGASTLGAGLLVSLACLLGVIGQSLGGRAADRFDLRAAYLTFFCLALPALLAMIALEGIALVLAAGWFVLFFLGMQPIENSLVARLTPPRWRSTSYGLKFTVTFGLGAGAVWIVNAARSSAWGTPAVFAVLAGVLTCVITGVLVLTLVSRGVDMHQTG